MRLTREKDNFECRMPGDCPVDEWLENHDIESGGAYFCDDCPFEKYINKLAEYEDREEEK